MVVPNDFDRNGPVNHVSETDSRIRDEMLLT